MIHKRKRKLETRKNNKCVNCTTETKATKEKLINKNKEQHQQQHITVKALSKKYYFGVGEI